MSLCNGACLHQYQIWVKALEGSILPLKVPSRGACIKINRKICRCPFARLWHSTWVALEFWLILTADKINCSQKNTLTCHSLFAGHQGTILAKHAFSGGDELYCGAASVHVGSVGSCSQSTNDVHTKNAVHASGLLLLLAGHWCHKDAVGGLQQQRTGHIQRHLPGAELEGEPACNRCQHDQSQNAQKCSGFAV